jgi:NAD(P)-dependent dehydrogenase (short-subunit alcohol dehydrogenase family)
MSIGTTGLADKVIVITGAARGLGRSYALHLAGLGARVVLNDIDAEVADVAAEITAGGGQALAFAGSVTDWELAGELLDTAVATFGPLHGVVANAGLYHVTPAVDESPEQIRASVDSNLVGTMHIGIQAIKRMVPAGSGVIVTTTSSSALGLEGASIYSAVKGAIMSLTYSWAIDLEGTGVRVNCIRPRALTRMSAVRGTVRPGARAAEDIAPLVEYLLDDRSAGLNGEVLGFDGVTLQRVLRAEARPLSTPPAWTLSSIADAVDSALEAS